jgi:hypothetical protein
MRCRHCEADLHLQFVDLGSAPPSNAYLTKDQLRMPESWFPLRVLVCTDCWLVQTEDTIGCADCFSADYAYFSSFSTSWLLHAKRYVDVMVERYGLNEHSQVIEVASNDGYLLQYVNALKIPCFGIEPTASTAGAAREKGIKVVEEFFSVDLASKLVAEGKCADLMVANNVLAHVPDIKDFVSGFALLLKPNGVATFEFPHLTRLVQENQFDTIYHEHFSYLSLVAVQRIFANSGLSVFDVEELPTHGGSLRIYAQRIDSGKREINERVARLQALEINAGVECVEYYAGFQAKAEQIKYDLLSFLISAKAAGKKVAAYGAAAKGNTLLNYAGIRADLIEFVVDRNPAKKGKFLPGSRIPIWDEAVLKQVKPDYLIVLPWNIKDEIASQLEYVRDWSGEFVVAVPSIGKTLGPSA